MAEISFLQYAHPDDLRTLCEEIAMPKEVTARLLLHLQTLDANAIQPHFPGLFSLDTGDESVKAIPQLCKTPEDDSGDSGLRALTVYLVAALHTRHIYTQMGIANEIYIDTIQIFRRFVMEHLESYGRYGFDRHFWIYRQLAARLFRIGELEYEMYHLHREPVGPAMVGDPVLSVHIPSDAVMTHEALDASYHNARVFFAQFFPNFAYKCVYCSTWLLSPTVTQFLKPGSRILNFQSDYELTQVALDVEGGMRWIFKRDYADLHDLPEDTSLQRGIKQVLLAGGKTGSGTGYVKAFDEKYSQPT